MSKKNILIFPAGAENALEIYESLRYNVNFNIYGASSKRDFAEYKYSPPNYIYANLYITNPNFFETFKKILSDYKIDFVIPTHDTIASYLAEHSFMFSAQLLCSPFTTTQMCNQKKLMYELIKDTSFCPKQYSIEDEINFPVFIKPNVGSGAVNTKLISSSAELVHYSQLNDCVICEYLPGKELTIDCYTNKKRELIFIGARSRDRIQMGIAFRSTTHETTNEIYDIAHTLNNRIEFFGAWYFQIKQDIHGIYKLLEVSCRQASSMTLYRHLGINFPALGLFELMGKDIDYLPLNKTCQIERCLHTAFHIDIEYENVYLDYDDTLIINNHVCDIVIRFIYQALNEGKKIFLITRHSKNIYDSLKQYKIAENIFDAIYHITFSEKKYTHITSYNSIFIDNSFAERKEVFEKLNIPVFDVDMLDMLLKQ